MNGGAPKMNFQKHKQQESLFLEPQIYFRLPSTCNITTSWTLVRIVPELLIRGDRKRKKETSIRHKAAVEYPVITK